MEMNSTIGNKIIIHKGAPLGNMWAKNPLKSVTVAQIKIGVQKLSLRDITTE